MEQPEYYTDIVKEYSQEKHIDNKNIISGFVIIQKQVHLPLGKTTIRGEYPKLVSDNRCSYPERADCNFGDFYNRCKYMEYSRGEWICSCPKNVKSLYTNNTSPFFT